MTERTGGLLRQLLHLASDLRGGLLLALILLFVDGVLDGSYILSLAVCPIWLVVAFIRASIGSSDNAVRAARVLLPQVTLLLVFTNYNLQAKMAMGNATRIIQACERYREANGSYPDRLVDLVPRFLGSVPNAKYCLGDASYRYRGPPVNTLAWTQVPPFGRRVYLFSEREWRYVD